MIHIALWSKHKAKTIRLLRSNGLGLHPSLDLAIHLESTRNPMHRI